jgi:hypothetical protein
MLGRFAIPQMSLASRDPGDLPDALSGLRVDPVEVELRAGTLPILRLSADDDPLRIGLAVVKTGHGKELPAATVFPILTEASFRVALLSRSSTVLLPRVQGSGLRALIRGWRELKNLKKLYLDSNSDSKCHSIMQVIDYKGRE